MPSEEFTSSGDIASIQADIAWTMERLLLLRERMQHPNFRHPSFINPNKAEKAALEKHLILMKKHAAIIDEGMRRQREVVARLERGGYSTAQAQALLDKFEQLKATTN